VQIKELNRATLARQMLLARSDATPARAVERLVGMQAQLARPPFIGLWSRLSGFRRDQLRQAAGRRRMVRATLMRGTIHLVTARDYLWLRPSLQPALSQIMRGFLRGGARFDVARIVEAARGFFAEQPRKFDELRGFLEKRFPGVDARLACLAVRMQLPLVQVPAGGPWAWPGAADFALAEEWLGEPLPRDAGPRTLVFRYLAAFGPATAADAQTWSALAGLREVFEELRPQLRSFRDARAGASCSICPRRRVHPAIRLRRCASSPSTTTCCSRTPTARG